MAVADRLPHGGAKLRGGPLAARQADGSRPAASAAKVTPHAGKETRNNQADRLCLDSGDAANAARASDLRRSIIERNPLERCGVRCSRRPKRSNSAIASVERISFASLPE